MAASPFLIQVAVGVILITLLKAFKRLREARQLSRRNKDSLLSMRGDLTPSLNIAEGRDTSLLSLLFRVGTRLFESRPVSTFCSKVLQVDIPAGSLLGPMPRCGSDEPGYRSAGKDLEVGPQDSEEKQGHESDGLSTSISIKPDFKKSVGVSDNMPSPPLATTTESVPSSTPSPTKSRRPYKAVRVLFLTWESDRYQDTPCNVLVHRLRELLGMTYQFTIQECTIPTTGLQSEHPDVAVLGYLISTGLLCKTVTTQQDDEDDEKAFNELVIVVYSGCGALIDGRYHLVTNTGSGHGVKTMPWEWFETRLASARYDSLCILNSSYVPETPVTTQGVRGSNMVLAAIGPDSTFRREVMAEIQESGKDKVKQTVKDQRPGTLPSPSSWRTGFLETVLNELEESSYRDVDGMKVSVDNLFRRLVMNHDRLCLGGGRRKGRVEEVGIQAEKEEVKRPFLGYIKGHQDGKYEHHRIIEIGLEGAKGRPREKSVPPGEAWTLVDGV